MNKFKKLRKQLKSHKPSKNEKLTGALIAVAALVGLGFLGNKKSKEE